MLVEIKRKKARDSLKSKVFFQKMKNSLLEENLKYLKKFKYFKSTSHFGFQLVSDLNWHYKFEMKLNKYI